MKTFVASVVMFLILASASTRAATDADVTIIKAGKVVIEEGVITIVAVSCHFHTSIFNNTNQTN